MRRTVDWEERDAHELNDLSPTETGRRFVADPLPQQQLAVVVSPQQSLYFIARLEYCDIYGEFDTAKRTATLEARGLDMARADEVFAGATLTVEDDRQDYGEDRFITIGFLDATMVVLVWTPRDGAHRVISMRKANERERTLYGPRF